MKKLISLAAIALVLSVVGNASAQGLPRYDPKGHCKEVASFGGEYSAMLDKSCLKIEQSAYNGLKAGWEDYPQSAKRHCNQVATFGGRGSYQLLQSCIDMEIEAAKSTPDFEF
ncbi:hypothetical protein SAMN04515647_4423 [Cohaesibacter sp. ES.047]|uniref:hypothetical protein n=1 Tax=Cohaesibacter sp. ES.047 TaxID=1798205 RepID=UPI000BC007D2|nr:hypothetical protein [Cohaesibacter sp. ES.047]SNY94100.1 hypothetical protein SAMN04515647_4423 [Cohaesibacter sp. ES.047]